MHPHSHGYQIYSSLQKAKLPQISASYQISPDDSLMSPQRAKSNSSSLILYDYEKSLKKQIKSSEIKEQMKQQQRRHKTLQAAHLQHKKSRLVQSCISEQLESLKYNLRSLSIIQESSIRKKQKLLHLKNHENYHQNLSIPQPFAPYYNPLSMQYPYNPYTNPQNPYINSNPYNNHLTYSNHPNSYSFSQPYQNYHSQQNIAHSPKHNPYVNLSNPQTKLSKIRTPKKSSHPSKPTQNLPISKQQSRYSTISESIPITKNASIRPKSKMEFNRSQFKKRLNHLEKHNLRQKAVQKMTKCFLVVYFCICLKNQALKIVKQRKKFFNTFWPQEYKKFIETFRDYFYNTFFPFFKLLKQRESTNLLPDGDDTLAIKVEKKKTFKEMIRVFFHCLKLIKGIDNLGKVAWGFCSNGSFVEKGVVTRNEMDFLCLDESNGTLLMDGNMQKSQIITLVMLKIILFEFVLNADKKWPLEFNKQKNATLTQNVKLVGSYIYEIMIQAQEFYLSKVNTQKYPMGNYHKNKSLQLQFAQPLMFQTKKVQAEIISGLYSQEFLKEKVNIKKTGPYEQIVKEVVEGLHMFVKRYDDKFRARVRNMAVRPKYKY